MSSSRSLRPWPRRCTTAHSARRWPGPGRRRARRSTQPSSGRLLLPSRNSSSSFEEEPGGLRPTGLVEPRGPQERIQRHTAEQMIESFVPVPMLDLDAPVPQMVDQLVDVLKLFDNSVPEQVIDVPKISQDAIPPRTVFCEPQLAEQLVEVPTPLPPSVLFIASDGHEWCRIAGPTGVYFWRVGTQHTQWRHLEGYTASPGGIEILGNADHALQVPAVLADLQWKVPQIRSSTECWTLQFSVGRLHARCCANDRAWVRQCCSAVAFL